MRLRLRLRTRPALSARYSWNRRISSDVAMSRDRFRNAANCLRIPLAIDVSVREEDAMTTQLLGGCACGAIRYACDVAPAAVFHCHRGGCQRSSGAPMSAVALVPRTRPHPRPKDTFWPSLVSDRNDTFSLSTSPGHFCADGRSSARANPTRSRDRPQVRAPVSIWN
jgi:hypothetical protein